MGLLKITGGERIFVELFGEKWRLMLESKVTFIVPIVYSMFTFGVYLYENFFVVLQKVLIVKLMFNSDFCNIKSDISIII